MPKYVMVTAISTHRMRYLIEMEENVVDPSPYRDYVVTNEVEEFSQHHLGEQIVDSVVVSAEEAINMFGRDHIEDNAAIFLGWTDEQKLRNAFKPDGSKGDPDATGE